MKSLFFFDEMITPKIITLIYWLLLLSAVIAGLGRMFTDFGITSLVTGVLVMIAAAVGARVWCELLIVLFKINENLQKLAAKEGALGE